MAFRVLTGEELSLTDLKAIIASHKKSSFQNVMEISWDEFRVNFDQFCTIFVEFKDAKLENKSFSEVIAWHFTNFVRAITAPFCRLLEWIIPKQALQTVSRSKPNEQPSSPCGFRDVHLGGSCGSTSWRTDIAIPILKKHGLTYVNPETSRWSERLIPIECAAVESCRVLLFVITNTSRSVASMALVNYKLLNLDKEPF